jgi:hypothetical protein
LGLIQGALRGRCLVPSIAPRLASCVGAFGLRVQAGTKRGARHQLGANY